MVEININRLIMLSDGFLLETSQDLITTTQYSLLIEDGIQQINKTYTPSTTSAAIIDSWGAYTPMDGNVCFTLSDSTVCPSITCSLSVI